MAKSDLAVIRPPLGDSLAEALVKPLLQNSTQQGTHNNHFMKAQDDTSSTISDFTSPSELNAIATSQLGEGRRRQRREVTEQQKTCVV